MLDQFTIGSVTRISPEAPVPVVTFARDEFRAGGAANVALNARALGAAVDLVGLVGADQAADRLRELLSAADLPSHALVTDDKRRTTAKVGSSRRAISRWLGSTTRPTRASRRHRAGGDRSGRRAVRVSRRRHRLRLSQGRRDTAVMSAVVAAARLAASACSSIQRFRISTSTPAHTDHAKSRRSRNRHAPAHQERRRRARGRGEVPRARAVRRRVDHARRARHVAELRRDRRRAAGHRARSVGCHRRRRHGRRDPRPGARRRRELRRSRATRQRSRRPRRRQFGPAVVTPAELLARF